MTTIPTTPPDTDDPVGLFDPEFTDEILRDLDGLAQGLANLIRTMRDELVRREKYITLLQGERAAVIANLVDVLNGLDPVEAAPRTPLEPVPDEPALPEEPTVPVDPLPPAATDQDRADLDEPEQTIGPAPTGPIDHEAGTDPVLEPIDNEHDTEPEPEVEGDGLSRMERAIVTYLTEEWDGRYEGSVKNLSSEPDLAGVGKPGSLVTATYGLIRRGVLDADRESSRGISAISLPAPAVDAFGPIETPPFDPDKVRAQAAEGL